MASFSLIGSTRLLLGLGALALAGCERKMPPLVDVFEVAPHTLERHERIEIHGAGFPLGSGPRSSSPGP